MLLQFSFFASLAEDAPVTRARTIGDGTPLSRPVGRMQVLHGGIRPGGEEQESTVGTCSRTSSV